MKKFYKVIKENFLREVWAIIQNSYGNGEGYEPIDELFKKFDWGEYITHHIIEWSPDYFTRVFPINLVSKTVYKAREEAKDYIWSLYSE